MCRLIYRIAAAKAIIAERVFFCSSGVACDIVEVCPLRLELNNYELNKAQTNAYELLSRETHRFREGSFRSAQYMLIYLAFWLEARAKRLN